MKQKYLQLTKLFSPGRFLPDEPLSKYSTFRIGGNADLFLKIKSTEELTMVIRKAKELEIPYFLIGGGTNLLISDEGFPGLVIKNESQNIRFAGLTGNKFRNNDITQIGVVYLEVDSGVSVNRLVRYTLDQGLSGLEFFLGQPGSIGGGLYINAHNARLGIFLGDNLYSATILTERGLVKKVNRNYFRFGYDYSIVQNTKDVILSAVFVFTKKDKDILWQTAQENFEYRKKTQPAGVYTSGCTFRNISKADAVRLTTPDFTCSSGYIIESLGLKGKKSGGAVISSRHANFIINQDNATSADVYALIREVKDVARKKYGLQMVEEIVLVGNF